MPRAAWAPGLRRWWGAEEGRGARAVSGGGGLVGREAGAGVGEVM